MRKEKTAIDSLDRKIIGGLFEDSRIDFKSIGGHLGLSKNAIRARYERLCKEGVITGATVQLNYRKLGYEAVAQLMLVVEPPQIEKVKKYLEKRLPLIFGPYIFVTRYNVKVIVSLKEISELNNLMENMRRDLPVTDLFPMIWTDVWFLPQNLTLIPIRLIGPMKEKMECQRAFWLDEKDRKIIDCLLIDSRRSFREIANELKTSTDTISRRYRKLKEERIIISRIQFNPDKVGYSGERYYSIRVSTDRKINEIINEIVSIPDVYYIMKCRGEYQISAHMGIKDVNQAIKTDKLISKIEGVVSIEATMYKLSQWPSPGSCASTF